MTCSPCPTDTVVGATPRQRWFLQQCGLTLGPITSWTSGKVLYGRPDGTVFERNLAMLSLPEALVGYDVLATDFDVPGVWSWQLADLIFDGYTGGSSTGTFRVNPVLQVTP